MKGWYKSGQELLQEMRETRVPEEMLSIWYLGQAGIVVKWKDFLVGIDLYLRDVERRLLPQPFTPEEAADLFDYVLCTHNHEDHLDEVTVAGIARGGSRTKFVVPAPHVHVLRELGIDESRIIPAKAWEAQTLQAQPAAAQSPASSSRQVVRDVSSSSPEREHSVDTVRLLPVPAAHEEFEYDAEGNYTCLGYILDFPAGRLYHAGDTIEWESMVADLAPQKPDIMCLPINGSDWKRKHQNVIGNLNSREAADIAEECGADLLIPLHFDMFAGNGENPAHLADYMFQDHKGHRYHVFAPGERFLYMKG